MADQAKGAEGAQDDKVWEAIGRSRSMLPLAVVLVAVVLGLLRGPGAAVLTMAAGALVAGITLFWTSLRVLVGDAPLTLEEAIGLGAPTGLDEEKRSILRALKDLEIEHGLGKLTDEDYRALSAKYRAQAKAVLQKMDEQMAPAREQAERVAAAYLAGEREAVDEEPALPKKAGKKKKAKSAKAVEAEAVPAEAAADETGGGEAEPRAEKAAGVVCSSCATSNDEDAAFCKKCGAKVGAAAG